MFSLVFLSSTQLFFVYPKGFCTAQVVGSDDVAASNNIGVLNGTPG